MNLTQWNRARVDQYAQRQNLSQEEARRKLLRIYGPRLDVEAVDKEMDPVLDERYQSINRLNYTQYKHHETTL